jgi:hypothetical protein
MNQTYKNIGNGLLVKIDGIVKKLDNKTVPINDTEFGRQLEEISEEIVRARTQFKIDIKKIVDERTPGINYNPRVGLAGRNNSTVNIKSILNKNNKSINLKSTGFPPIMSMDSVISVLKKMNNMRKQKANNNLLEKSKKNKANRRRNILELRRLINGGNKPVNSALRQFGTAKN